MYSIFHGLVQLAELGELQEQPSVQTISSAIFAAAGVDAATPRQWVPDVLQAEAATALLQQTLPLTPQLHMSDISRLVGGEEQGFGAEQVVPLDPLVAIACLACSGPLASKMALAQWAVDRDGDGAVSVEDVQAVVAVLRTVGAAAPLLLGEPQRQGPGREQQQQLMQVLLLVVAVAWGEVAQGKALLPATHMPALLYAAAAHLATIMADDAPPEAVVTRLRAAAAARRAPLQRPQLTGSASALSGGDADSAAPLASAASSKRDDAFAPVPQPQPQSLRVVPSGASTPALPRATEAARGAVARTRSAPLDPSDDLPPEVALRGRAPDGGGSDANTSLLSIGISLDSAVRAAEAAQRHAAQQRNGGAGAAGVGGGGGGVGGGGGGTAASAGAQPASVAAEAARVLQQLQDNLLAASVRLALNCCACLLAVTALLLGDAALVAALQHDHLSLEAALTVAMGFNLAVAALIVVGLSLRRAWDANAAALRPRRHAGRAAEPAPLDALVAAIRDSLAPSRGKPGSGSGEGGGGGAGAGAGLLPRGGGPLRQHDEEAGGTDGGGGGGGAFDAGAAAAAGGGRLATVWNAVGKMIGAVPPERAGGQWQPLGNRAGSSSLVRLDTLQLRGTDGGGGAGGEGGGEDAPGAPPRAQRARLAGHAAPVSSVVEPATRAREAYPR